LEYKEGWRQLKLGIIGLPGSGKSTVFRALTGGIESGERRGHQDPALGVVKVSDPRLDFLVEYQKPKKVTPVHVEYMDIAGITGEGKPGRSLGDKTLANIRPLDAILHCVRFFDSPALGKPEPLRDYIAVEEEMILSDLAVIEKRLERLTKDVQRGRKDLAHELELLQQAQVLLNDGKPLRTFPPASESEELRGFSFLSAKPELILLNAGENKSRDNIGSALGEIRGHVEGQPDVALDWLYADSEAEIARLDEEEAKEFLQDLALEEGAKERIIRTSFALLNLIVFFTVGEPEARAWQLKKGTTAVKAAGTIHSDIERGFIRAEVVGYDDFVQAGSMAAAHKAGKVRLEGKDYVMKDGDIVLFRFNV
jgi:ribosome-binding ATPase